MKSLSPIRVLCGLLLSALCLLPDVAQGIGQITEPIIIDSALRTMAYERTVSVVNTDDRTAVIALSAEGALASWVSFHADADADALTEITLEPKSRREVLARFTVPAGTPNGTYTGYVTVSSKPDSFQSAENESGSALTQRIERVVSITVTDQEKVAFDASIIPERYDLSKGELLKVRVLYDNQSNVSIRPQIDLKIVQGEATGYSAIFPYPETVAAVKPGAIYEIPTLEIPTSNLAGGEYTARLRLSEGDKSTIEKEFRFSVGMVKGASTADAGSSPRVSSELILAVTGLLVLLILLRPKFSHKNKDRINIH